MISTVLISARENLKIQFNPSKLLRKVQDKHKTGRMNVMTTLEFIIKWNYLHLFYPLILTCCPLTWDIN